MMLLSRKNANLHSNPIRPQEASQLAAILRGENAISLAMNQQNRAPQQGLRIRRGVRQRLRNLGCCVLGSGQSIEFWHPATSEAHVEPRLGLTTFEN
jgi:hypothetical protein